MKLGKKGKQSDFLAAVEDVPTFTKPEVQAAQLESKSTQHLQEDGASSTETHEWVRAGSRKRFTVTIDHRHI